MRIAKPLFQLLDRHPTPVKLHGPLFIFRSDRLVPQLDTFTSKQVKKSTL